MAIAQPPVVGSGIRVGATSLNEVPKGGCLRYSRSEPGSGK
jgi:hypothetical protein